MTDLELEPAGEGERLIDFNKSLPFFLPIEYIEDVYGIEFANNVPNTSIRHCSY